MNTIEVNTEQSFEKPCIEIDSFEFNKSMSLDDPLLMNFLSPIVSIDSLILSESTSHKKIQFSEQIPIIHGWYKDSQLIKIKHDNFSHSRWGGERNQMPKLTHEYYIIDDCNWVYRSERRGLEIDSLMDIAILSFKDSLNINCIRAVNPEPITSYYSSKPSNIPKKNIFLIWTDFNSKKEELSAHENYP
jgi:hypothetical protein